MRSPGEMREEMLRLASDGDARQRLAENGLDTILARHACAHRAEQLEAIFADVSAVL